MQRGLFDSIDEEQGSDKPLTVSQLTQRIKGVLEHQLGTFWVTGEISNLSRPRSGHFYFNLKDENAVLPVAMWRSTAARLKFDLDDGQEVVCQGSLDVYAPHGAYKLIVRKIEPLGLGPLQLAFQQMFEKLAKEGLFAPEKKQQLPAFPRRVAVVTSPTGAAIRDFIQTAKRRWPLAEILIIPAKVQGAGAAQEIADGIELANLLRPKLDLIVAARGGGSMEDLWCFNEEKVVRAIFASQVPVVSAVGHEVDVTLSDLVADVRALTPTAAAEIIFPSQTEIESRLSQNNRRLQRSLINRLEQSKARLDSLAQRIPFRRPMDGIRLREQKLDELGKRAERAVGLQVQNQKQQLRELAAKLESISPLNVLSRGYSIVQTDDGKQVVRSATQLKQGDAIVCRFKEGSVTAEVKEIESKSDNN